jgi:SPASM domain peptide maturase of grasp-with-spasm system
LVLPFYFTLNITSFTEAQKYNSCLNQKIAIDEEGMIKNCPSMKNSFGNIQNTTLQKAMKHQDFKKLWHINKNQIAICKDCEFRYICTDCRAFITEPDNLYSKPFKCTYNPYTTNWE